MKLKNSLIRYHQTMLNIDNLYIYDDSYIYNHIISFVLINIPNDRKSRYRL